MKRILIVDDEPFNLDLLSQILEEDYEVIEASMAEKVSRRLGPKSQILFCWTF